MGIGMIVFSGAIFRKRVAMNMGLKSGLWIAPYLLGLITISYLGAFGGKNIIPFGWDFLVIAIFSLVIFYLAVVNRATVTQEKMIEHTLAAIQAEVTNLTDVQKPVPIA